MSLPKIFFSYSRLDSDFALRLAKDIRSQGVDIWIDQLDIPAGNHWDAAVEKALITSSCVLVILSPSSTASNNVKDEISFALDTGKKIIPVLLEECLAPFRLRRLQHIDFTKDYEDGLKQLLSSLRKPVAIMAKATAPGETDEEDQTPSRRQAVNPQSDEEIREAQLWDEACRLNSIVSFTGYLQETVLGEYKDEARLMIKQLEVEEKEEELDMLLWQKAKSAQSITLYHHYLGEFPEGRYRTLAVAALEDLEKQERLDQLQPKTISKKVIAPVSPVRKFFSRTNAILASGVIVLALVWGFSASVNSPEDKELTAWRKAYEKNDITSLRQYLAGFPNGKYSISARQLLDSLQGLQGKSLDSLSLALINDSLACLMPTLVLTIPDTTQKSGPDPKSKTQLQPKAIQSKYKIGQVMEGGRVVFINKTGLHGLIVYEKDLPAQDWRTAQKKCANLKAGNFYDWRLPTKEELNKIYLSKKINGPFSKGFYWSSTAGTDNTAIAFSLEDGRSLLFKPEMTWYVRPVRDF